METICKCGKEKAWDEKMCQDCYMKMRQTFIGGSDIAAILGVSRWKTPLQVWSEKTGRIKPEDLSGVEAVQLGIELEEFVAKKFEKATGKKVRKAPQRYIHPDYPHFACQVDRLITGTDDLLEVKTCSAWKAREWEGEDIPNEYIIQVLWQLFITGRKDGYIAVLIGGQMFKWKKVEYDPNLVSKMVETAEKFWDMVVEDIPPMAGEDDRELLLKLYPEQKTDEMIQAIQEMEVEIARLQELKGHIKELGDQKTEIENKLRQVIGDNLGIITEKYRVTNKKQKTAPKVLFDLMRNDGVYDKYTMENYTRVLRVSLNKEGGKAGA